TLALDHAEEGALARAKTAVAAAKDAVSEENKYIVAASAMVAYLEGRYEEGIAEIAAIVDRGGDDVLIQLENYRLRSKIDPEDEKTKLSFRKLLDMSSGEPRALSYLGWHYYNEGDFTRADARFDSALKNSKNHTRSLIGVTLVDLDRGIGLDERQKELEKNIKKVFALPAGELSSRDRALGHFARAQLLQWQNKPTEAKADYDKAYEIDPENPLFDYRRGMQLLKQGDATEAVVFLKKAAAKDPENISVITELVKAQVKGREYDAAIATLKRANELAKGDKSLVLLEAEVLGGQRKYSDARKLYQSITQEDGGRSLAEAYIGISSTYRVSGDSSKAVTFMQEKLEDAPKGMG
ncbi:MAG: tetratricopeptide repeat protein, partial [Myxococcota bacterium]